MDELDMSVIYLFYPNIESVIDRHCDSPTWHGMIHACEFETSLMLALKPELVQMDKAVRQGSEYPKKKPNLYGKSTISLGNLSQSGVYGKCYSCNKGKRRKNDRYFH